MTRFIPAQIKAWTSGQLIQSSRAEDQIDRFYRGISTDSRNLRQDQIFVALSGERFDGHDFLTTAIEKKAGMLVVDEKHEEAMKLYHRLSQGEELPDLLLVPDTLQAYQRIAEGYRQTLLATVIGITGSVGKTTARRMVSTVIAAQVAVHETEDNKNNLIGVPLTLLQADDADQVIVAEMAMDRRGEIEVLSRLAHPDIALITNIGYSHAEYLGSRENILKEKTDIICGMHNNGFVVINAQDELLREWALQQTEGPSIWCVSNRPIAADSLLAQRPCFWAEAVELRAESTSFICKSNLDPDLALEVEVPAPGLYLVRAALFALTSCYALGLDMKAAAQACRNFVNTGSRQRIHTYREGVILDDSYNASPESVATALETLELLAQGRRRIVCLAGMRELGQYESEQHLRLAERLAELAPDEIHLVGEECRVMLNFLKERQVQVFHYDNSEELAATLPERLREEDCILLKGSRSYRMERVGTAILQEQEEVQC